MDASPKTAMTEADVQAAYVRESDNIPKYSGKLSELCKYVWAGSLATLYALLTATADSPAAKFFVANRSLIVGAAVAGSLALIFDYFQNVAAYQHSKKITAWMEKQTVFYREDLNAQTESGWERASWWLFAVKNICAVVAAVCLGLSVLFALRP